MHEHEHAEGPHDGRPIRHGLRHGRRIRRHHGGHVGHGRHGFDPAFVDRRRCLDREALLTKLERYQRDLEERTADVADTIRRLKALAPAPSDPDTSITAV